MREIIELQSGQVAFLSGLMAGFSLSVAAHILRHGMRDRMAQLVFITLLLSTLLFLLALYVDVRLTIELAGVENISDELAGRIRAVRVIGTNSATAALILFIVAIGLLGWLATALLGIISSLLAATVLFTLWLLWVDINVISTLLASQPG